MAQDDILPYAGKPARPPTPTGYAVIVLLLALAPLIAIPFAPTGRQFALPTAFLCFGTLFSPVNFAFAFALTRRYPRKTAPFAFAVFAAVLAGINTALLLLAILLVAINGMPC